jgi:FtsZ-interacting cell division protein ZipA
MDELTLGLAGAGVVVVAGVVVYNMWQDAKVRRRMPRPMPDETSEALARQDADEAQFIEPVRHSTLAGQTAYVAPAPAAAEGEYAGDSRREPSIAPVGADGAAQRVEPTFGTPEAGVSEAAVEAVAAAAESHEETPAEYAGTTAADIASQSEAQHEPVMPAATTISAAPPALVDRRIDCIVPIRVAAPVAADKILPAAQRLRRAGNKPVYIEGKTEAGHWELLQNGARYEELRAAAQLANRNGPLNELEFSEFVSGVQQFADTFDGAPDFPDMMEIVGMARELDGFAAQCDAQLSLNVMSDGAPWSANYVQAVASQDGLLLSRDGTRFVKLDARQNPVFMLQFGDTNFLRDDLTYKGGNMITLVLDVPVADEDILPFRLMCDYAKSLSARIGARVVDDQRRTLPESTLKSIEEQLLKLYAKLEAAGIPAGSPATRRLFSQ